ncbi:MAG: hypothetical protein ACE5WD_10350 [Candidatus Aminicenantia bacterium]
MNGYIALISILIISALLVIIASSANLISISESDMGLQENQSWESFYLATACVENALMELKKDLDYGGNEVLTFEDETCTILPLEGTGNENRIIKVLSSAYNQVRKIKIEIDKVYPEMEIRSWQEVADF